MRFHDCFIRPMAIVRALVMLLMAVASLLAITPIYAATFVVTSLKDDNGTGELRWAIEQANGSPNSKITFHSGLSGTITLSRDLPAITGTITIQGPGASVIAIDGNNQQFRLIHIDTLGFVVKLSGLRIQNGNDQADRLGGGGIQITSGNVTIEDCMVLDNLGKNGGGINNSGTATIKNCTVSGNIAYGGENSNGDGGGINNSGTATITNCSVSGNISQDVNAAFGGSGGGISNSGTATITGCTVSENRSSGWMGGNGGGINNFGTAMITNCMVYHNSADGYGGGMANVGGDATLTNVVLSYNGTPNSGGGMYNGGRDNTGGTTAGLSTLTNCTLAANGANGSGGGIFNNNSATATFKNCILYGDLAQSGAEIAGDGTLSTEYCDIQGGYAGSHNINAAPLFVNSPTDLHITYNSPCRGKGTIQGAPTTTIDGLTRSNPPSIGAYEVEPKTILKSSLNPSVVDQNVTFTATVTPATTTGTVTFTIGNTPVTIALSNGSVNYTTSSLSDGLHTVTATYNGNAVFAPSNSLPLTQRVIGPPIVSGISPNAGPLTGNTSVTITGTGFVSGAKVKFGNVTAPFARVVSTTSIVCTSPPGSGTVDVTVITLGGTSSNSSADNFTYNPVPAVSGISPNAGPLTGNTSVTITGTGFVSGATVRFGTVPATNINVVSETAITCTTPAGSNTVDVTVTTPGGRSPISAADKFTYVRVPSVTRVSPNTGLPAGGTTVTITGIGFVSGATVRFGTVPATNINVVSATAITCTTPAGSGTVDVTVTTPGGTSPTSTVDKFTYSVPILSTFTLNPTIIAPGGSTVATVTLTGPAPTGGATVTITTGSGPFGYGLTIPAGASSATVTLNAASNAIPGTYTFTATYGGKSLTATLTIK